MHAQGANTQWIPYYHSDFTVVFPSDWELDTSHQSNTSFILFSPLTDKNDRFKENVNLLVQDLSRSPVDLDQFVKISERDLRTISESVYFLKNHRKSSAGRPVLHLMYTLGLGGFDLTFEQYMWVIRKEAFVLTFTCQEKTYDQYKAVGQKILNSFRLK
ncbi:MAG TPA: hypothetical protein DCF33_20555 [Saprospirales bacterium]|nr:hypothetical protein [Saprospirales bacterium]